MSVKNLSIDLLNTEGGTQMRAELTQDVYLDYRDKWIAGVSFDPVDVFFDGSTYWLADGFHRFYGAREAKKASIPCRIHNGTQRDAILFACGANASHGLRRTNADKRRAIESLLGDEEWCKWSDHKIAEKAAVSVTTVGDVRRQLSKLDSSPAAKSADAPRVGRDGKKRKPPSAKKLLSQSDAPQNGTESEPPKQYNDQFDPTTFDKPKPGRIKGFDDNLLKTAYRELSQAIDEHYKGIIALYEQRREEIGGVGYGAAVGAAKTAQSKCHDAVDLSLKAYKAWRDK